MKTIKQIQHGNCIICIVVALVYWISIAAYARPDELTNNIIPRLVVGSVLTGGVGDMAGIKVGDTVLEVAGKQILDINDAVNELKSAGTAFDIKLKNGNSERVVAIKRAQDELLGVNILEQLPTGHIPFGYVLTWYDGIVLDPFSGRLKQAKVVLNPYTLGRETAQTIKTKGGFKLFGDTIPCGGKHVYTDSQGRPFSVVNELISLPEGQWRIEDLTQTAQWPFLRLQPFMLSLKNQASDTTIAQAATEKEKEYAQFRTGDVETDVIEGDKVAHWEDLNKGIILKPPTNSRCYLTVQRVYIATWQNKITFHNDTGYDNIDYTQPVYSIIRYDPKTLKEDSTNSLERALFYFHRIQSGMKPQRGEEFLPRLLELPFAALEAHRDLMQIDPAYETKSVRMYKNLETSDTIKQAQEKLGANPDVKNINVNTNFVTFQTEYLGKPVNVTVGWGHAGTLALVVVKLAADNPLGLMISKEVNKSEAQKELEDAKKDLQSPSQREEELQKRLSALEQAKQLGEISKDWEKSITDKYPDRKSQGGRIRYILPSELVNQKVQSATRVESPSDIFDTTRKVNTLTAGMIPEFWIVDQVVNSKSKENDALDALKSAANQTITDKQKRQKSLNDF